MRTTITTTVPFFAGHVIPGHSTCGRQHGHDWSVAVSLESSLNPQDGLVVEHGAFQHAVEELVAEFNGRNINDLLPGVLPTPEGIAQYVHERLVFEYPVTKVTVVMSRSISATVEWPSR